jgi:hydroxymethylpyrimidine/phosphomethylpyrimidine kinase
MRARPFALSIAAFDPCAGAGVSADIKTLEANGARGLGTTTAITYQSDSAFHGIDWLSFDKIEQQLDALFAVYEIAVCKVGLVESLESLLKIIESLQSKNPAIRIIWDPILRASAGFEFHKNLNPSTLRRVLENIELITPNADEWQSLAALVGEAAIKERCAVFLKGGHNLGNADDVLYVDDKEIALSSVRLNEKYSKHGTGCALSAAIAAALAKGSSVQSACALGKAYVKRLMLSNETKLGAHFG